MDSNIQKFKDFLEVRFPNLKNIKHSFEFCSKYGDNKYLVNSQMKTINFDKLTEWYTESTQKPQSADSLSFNDKYVYLIEFKSGDPTTHNNKLEKLIDDVIGKINDSDATLSNLYLEAFGNESDRLKENFCLVVDSKQMGITPLTTTLTSLSLKHNSFSSEKDRIIFEKIYPDLKLGVQEAEHYSKIEIWYSELFDQYLQVKRIESSVPIT